MSRLLAIVLVAAALSLCVAPATARASVTIGSNLAAAPGDGPCGFGVSVVTFDCAYWQTDLLVSHAAPGGVTSPVNGVVVKWRVKYATQSGDLTNIKVRPHLFPGAPTDALAFVDLPLVGPGVLGVASRFPIRAGDSVGEDSLLTGGPLGGGTPTLALGGGGGTLNSYHPNPGPGETPTPLVTGSYELLMNADVEPDADHDGYGDETQDRCSSDASTQSSCLDRTAPSATVSLASRQDLVKQRAVIASVSSNEAGSAAGSGTLNVSGTSKSYGLVPTTVPLDANKRTKLVLKIPRKALKATRKAQRKRRKVRASVTIQAKDAAGNASGATKLSVSAKKRVKKSR